METSRNAFLWKGSINSLLSYIIHVLQSSFMINTVVFLFIKNNFTTDACFVSESRYLICSGR